MGFLSGESEEDAVQVVIHLASILNAVSGAKATRVGIGQSLEVEVPLTEPDDDASLAKRVIVSMLTSSGRVMTTISSPNQDLIDYVLDGTPSESWGVYESQFIPYITDADGNPVIKVSKLSYSERPRAAMGISDITKTSGRPRGSY